MGSVQVTWKFPNWAKKITEKKNDLMLLAAASIQTNRAMLFQNEGAYNGHKKWAPLKTRDGQILAKSGALKNSIGPMGASVRPMKKLGSIVQFKGDDVQVGTNLPYAPIQNYGGVITPKRPGGVLRFWHEKAGKFVFAKKVTIPARPFGQEAWNEEDQAEVETTLKNKMVQILNG